MRISDWSSDVCSSDLRSSFKGFIFGVFKAEDLIRNSISAEQAHRLDLELYDITGGRRRLLYDSRPEMWSARSVERSEEHTSELQSLMRISYAVFCLKKKNTNYTHNVEHITPLM